MPVSKPTFLAICSVFPEKWDSGKLADQHRLTYLTYAVRLQRYSYFPEAVLLLGNPLAHPKKGVGYLRFADFPKACLYRSKKHTPLRQSRLSFPYVAILSFADH